MCKGDTCGNRATKGYRSVFRVMGPHGPVSLCHACPHWISWTLKALRLLASWLLAVWAGRMAGQIWQRSNERTG